jgi:hypothetical protein
MLNKKIPKNLIERKILESLKKELDKEEILLLVGSRQVGKSSLMFLLLNILQRENIAQSQIFYFDLENIIVAEQLNKIKDFEKFPQLLLDQRADFKKRVWVFIDEIQYLDHPSSFLKYLYDHYRGEIKFVICGSSTLEIKKKFTDRLTGRVSTFIVYPLDFSEYLRFKRQENLYLKKQEVDLFKIINEGDFLLPSWYESLKDYFQEAFEEFVIFGGYPKPVLRQEQYTKIEDLGNIYSLYVRKDIKDIAHIEDVKGFNHLVGMLAHQIGSLVNESELSVGTGLSRPTIKKYLFLLENTFICYLLSPFFTNARLEYTKMPKAYFIDSGLRNTAINMFQALEARPDLGHLIENSVLSEILKNLPFLHEVHFWKSERGTEVDFVIKGKDASLFPIEIKYQPFKKPKLPSGLRSFIKRYKPKLAFVLTKDFYFQESLNSTKIFWLPCWLI